VPHHMVTINFTIAQVYSYSDISCSQFAYNFRNSHSPQNRTDQGTPLPLLLHLHHFIDNIKRDQT
jgi:hypothetical protein